MANLWASRAVVMNDEAESQVVGVFKQNFYINQLVHETVEMETCTPGVLSQTCTTEPESHPKLDEHGEVITQTQCVRLQSYHIVLQPERAWRAFSEGGLSVLSTLNFWRALRFTLTFTLITLPMLIVCGLGIAVLIDNAARSTRRTSASAMLTSSASSSCFFPLRRTLRDHKGALICLHARFAGRSACG